MEATSAVSGRGLMMLATSGTEKGDFDIAFILSIDVAVG
jgi:hypothetical protein